MKADNSGGRFAYDGLDRLMHEKARLSIMASLYTRTAGHNFNELKKLCSLTDGNLSRHMSILKEAGLVKVIKGYEGNKPNTLCILTDDGRRRFRAYLSELEQVIRDAAAESMPLGTVNEKHGLSPV